MKHTITIFCLCAFASIGLTTTARAACDAETPVPVSLQITPASRVLFYGDSISAGFLRNSHHYAALVQELLRESYCDFSDFEVTGKGRRGSHYARYQRLISGILSQEAKDGPPVTLLFLQDAGRALRTERPSRPDSNRLFGNAVANTIDVSRATTAGIAVVVADTPGLDTHNQSRKFVRLYERQNDWIDHNVILSDIADGRSAPVLPWQDDFCEARAANPTAAWTVDGVHPAALGDLALALSITKFLGVPEQDLRFGSLETLDPDLDSVSAAAIASSIYSPLDLCP